MFALVTGASGLLGRHLTEELVRRGHRVRTLDVKPAINMPEGAEVMRGDIRNADTTRSACERVDVVFHLAALLPQSRAAADTLYSVNVKGTETMLSAAVSESVKRFVYSSSVEIYGVPDRVPCTEDSPKKLLGTYSRTKLDCEEVCARYSADFGIETVMMRMPMIVGPGYWHEKFFAKMFGDLGRGKPVRIIGDGENRYHMVSCSDVVDAYVLAAEAPAAAGEAFNVASDPAKVLPVREMVQAVMARVGSKSKVSRVNKTLARAVIKLTSAVGRPLILKEYHEVAFADYVFDIKKAQQLLKYAPKKDDVEAMVETVKWYWNSIGEREAH
ncbi:MAG: NAD(P)-dependent oxidoreductase [Candidatus Lindowbacteria bacterium]|nr:NAD(P)-dependent oxidoreductase [Candidatus Lindowbacteria bacterium]